MLIGKIKHLLMEEIKETPAGGAPVESEKSATPPPATPTPPVQKAGETTVDDYGYEIPKSQQGNADKKADPAAKSEQQEAAGGDENDEVKEPVSGYNEKEIIAAAKEEPAKKEEEKKEPPKSLKEELGYELAVPDAKELPKEDSQKIVDLAKAHKLPKEATEALLAQKKSEYQSFLSAQKESQEAYKKAVTEQKASWYKELQNDPEFGGEKLNKSLNRAEKVLQDFFPNTKKELTARKSMLPPYVMRDLAKAYEHLYRPEKFTQGDKISDDKKNDDKEENNPLDFYT